MSGPVHRTIRTENLQPASNQPYKVHPDDLLLEFAFEDLSDPERTAALKAIEGQDLIIAAVDTRNGQLLRDGSKNPTRGRVKSVVLRDYDTRSVEGIAWSVDIFTEEPPYPAMNLTHSRAADANLKLVLSKASEGGC